MYKPNRSLHSRSERVLDATKCGQFEWQPDKQAVSGKACSVQRAQPPYGVLAYTALTKLSRPCMSSNDLTNREQAGRGVHPS
jgi:hypothetical protein